MTTCVHTVAFEGVEARLVEVQCTLAPGLPAFAIVGLPDKAVSEARERIRAALAAMAIALPAQRITVNLSPADLPKIGSHFDLPIALALLSALGALPADAIGGAIALGELSLDGRVIAVAGVLPAAMRAAREDRALICPEACGAEAAWVGDCRVIAAPDLGAALRHLIGRTILPAPAPQIAADGEAARDIREVRGQEGAKRALEIAAAGGHHLLMLGPPGAGKSMLADCMAGLLPDLSPAEALETSMIHSLAGLCKDGGMARRRPFRAPHHSASTAAITGGGREARPGEISLAHNGVLFLDELPEFARPVLETLRQPIETGHVTIARVNAHVRYPSRFQLLAAANPCRCGHLHDAARACRHAPGCGADYLRRISGPIMDRFDMRIEVPPAALDDLLAPQGGEGSAIVAARVATARGLQMRRFAGLDGIRTNSEAAGETLTQIARPDTDGLALIGRIDERFGLSARGYHRILRLARTIADLDGSADVRHPHIAEAARLRFSRLAG